MSRYFAEIGRRGGLKSRRVLTPEVARRMVEIREARRIARRVHQNARLGGTPSDTSPAVQAIQDALLRRFSPAEKLARVARLSRMVDLLSFEGLTQRYPKADAALLQRRRAESRLGLELAARVFGDRGDIA